MKAGLAASSPVQLDNAKSFFGPSACKWTAAPSVCGQHRRIAFTEVGYCGLPYRFPGQRIAASACYPPGHWAHAFRQGHTKLLRQPTGYVRTCSRLVIHTRSRAPSSSILFHFQQTDAPAARRHPRGEYDCELLWLLRYMLAIAHAARSAAVRHGHDAPPQRTTLAGTPLRKATSSRANQGPWRYPMPRAGLFSVTHFAWPGVNPGAGHLKQVLNGCALLQPSPEPLQPFHMNNFWYSWRHGCRPPGPVDR